MRKIIIPIIFLAILILGFNKLDIRAQEYNSTIVLNPGATNSASQNPISPANVTVPAGTNVTWINRDSSPHMLVSGTPDKGPNNIFYGDFFGTDKNYTVTFNEPGLYSYYDPVWSHIRGVVTVENPGFSTDQKSNMNDSNINSIDDNLLLDSDTGSIINSDINGTNISENGSFSFPSSSFISSLPRSTTNDTSDPSSPPSSLASVQSLTNIINKVGPLLGLLMNGGSSSLTPSSSLSSLSQLDGMFGEALTNASSISNDKTGNKILVDENSSSLLNDTFTVQNKSVASLEEERAKVQEDLINVLRKAYSIGAEIPELPTFLNESDNATIFIKVNVFNPIDKKANASDFPIKINYEYGDGIAGASYTYANEAGRIETLPASIYAILAEASQTNDPAKDSFLNSYSTLYSKGCSGHIEYTETKDCVITKKYTNITNNISMDSGN